MTAAQRQGMLLDPVGMLIPDGTIDATDRQFLVGDYVPVGTPDTVPGFITVSGGGRRVAVAGGGRRVTVSGGGRT